MISISLELSISLQERSGPPHTSLRKKRSLRRSNVLKREERCPPVHKEEPDRCGHLSRILSLSHGTSSLWSYRPERRRKMRFICLGPVGAPPWRRVAQGLPDGTFYPLVPSRCCISMEPKGWKGYRPKGFFDLSRPHDARFLYFWRP